MRRLVIRFLLALLNSRWLNGTPCQYGYINNLEAFSLENLESEEKQRPGITVRTILDQAALFRSCPVSKHGLTVIEGGEIREATARDLRELERSLASEEEGIV